MTAIKKVLIANRGEIAVRIARTLRAMGIRSVGLYHRDDRRSPHVGAVDEAVEVTGPSPVAAHLDIAQIVALARGAGADAVHPGFGFLSENAEFPRLLDEAGLVFIGPNSDVIALMGDKVAARNFVAERGFPVAPSALEEDDPKGFLDRAATIGFPILLKAAAGGGGKGMTAVRDKAELEAAAKRASGEAKRYFGDGRLYAEKLVERPRHIEVQVLADAHGTVVHLGERECSIQRRFQKVIEEAPAPGLKKTLRDEICAAAVGIAEAAGYLGAGTVEFILAPDGAFYFLEMNTRLQVEHPVTEAVTGVDLVEQQVRVARGETLAFKQKDIAPIGHAIEARIYAEDADGGFLPATGEILGLHVPQGPGIRFDGGIAVGQAITPAFDPMLAKLIAHAGTRDAAVARLRAALGDLAVLGVTTNTAWLARVLGHPAFAKGELHTGFIEEHADGLAPPPLDDGLRDALLAAAALSAGHEVRAIPEPYASMGDWRN